MKYNYLLFLFLLLSFSAAEAQINLIGAGNGSASGMIDIVEWQALAPASVTTAPTILQAYLLGSSVFDAWNSNYYLAGVTPGSSGLLSFNSLTNTQIFSNFSSFSNITEIDMSTGNIYTLTADSTGYFSVNEFNIATGTDSLLGVVSEPGNQGLVVDATGFDSNHGILFYIGYKSNGENCLYKIEVRNPVFSFTKTILNTTAAVNHFNSVNYDNVNDLMFVLHREQDSAWTGHTMQITEINVNTGDLIPRAELQGFTGFQVGSSSFDQFTGSFLLVGINSSFTPQMIVFNTADNTYQAGWVPAGVSEIVCDNNDFAQSFYGTTSVIDPVMAGLSIFPNPASGHFRLNTGPWKGDCRVTIYNTNGRECFTTTVSQSVTDFSTGFLKLGVYGVKVEDGQQVRISKLVIR